MKKIIFFILILFLVGCAKGPGEFDSFAQCLTEKGATMYGTAWCSHCKNQKAAFGSSFQFVDYVDCDQESGKCKLAGVESYPTWIIDGEKYPGEQTFGISRLCRNR